MQKWAFGNTRFRSVSINYYFCVYFVVVAVVGEFSCCSVSYLHISLTLKNTTVYRVMYRIGNNGDHYVFIWYECCEYSRLHFSFSLASICTQHFCLFICLLNQVFSCNFTCFFLLSAVSKLWLDEFVVRNFFFSSTFNCLRNICVCVCVCTHPSFDSLRTFGTKSLTHSITLTLLK